MKDSFVDSNITNSPSPLSEEIWQWTSENIIHPAVNAAFIESGNAVVNVVNGVSEQLVGREVVDHMEKYSVPTAEFLTGKWLAQSISSSLGAILPYVAAGKLAGGALRGTGQLAGLRGNAASFIASEKTAQILGAGMLDGMKDLNPGETRLGNALSGMAAFGIYEHGNALSKGLSGVRLVGSRMVTGALGGMTHTTVSHLISKGELASSTDLIQGAVSGSILNVALPAMQDTFGKTVDTINTTTGRGVPLQRYIDGIGVEGKSATLDSLVKENALTRIQTQAGDTALITHNNNRIQMPAELQGKTELASKLGHELSHGQTVNSPEFQAKLQGVRELLAAGDEAAALKKYCETRLEQEMAARHTESKIAADISGHSDPSISKMSEQVRDAYETHWKQEFEQLRNMAGGKYKPSTDYSLLNKHRFIKSADGRTLVESAEPTSVKVLLEQAVKSKTDLSQVHLKDTLLAHANLAKANLREAQITQSTLLRANLSGADLSRSSLTGADLRSADLRGANLKEAELKHVSLQEADLSDANLHGAVFKNGNLNNSTLDGAILESAQLNGADLRGASISGANLKNAQLENAKLTDAYLAESDLSGANLRGADLSGLDLRGVKLEGADLSGANLAGANLKDAIATGATLRGANLAGADLSGLDLTRVQLNGISNEHLTNLQGAILKGSKLSGADLSRVDLLGSNLDGFDLSKANLSNSILAKSSLVDANFADANLNNANLNMADVRLANFTGANCQNASFCLTTTKYARLENTNLTGADLRSQILDEFDLGPGLNLTGANLNSAGLYNLDLSAKSTTLIAGISLKDAQIINVDFRGQDLTRVDLTKAYVDESDFRGAKLHSNQFQETELGESNIFDAVEGTQNK